MPSAYEGTDNVSSGSAAYHIVQAQILIEKDKKASAKYTFDIS